MINFRERKLAIATKHDKEKVIAPLFELELGVQCIVPENLDTDLFGTFTGEIERQADPVEVARNKCLKALEITGFDLAISSEGSFGQHPYLFFAPANEEFLFFMDRRNDLEIVVRNLSTQTNFAARELTSEKELQDFAEKAQFPSHGLILKKGRDIVQDCIKGITNWEQLRLGFLKIVQQQGTAFVETDMRACYNPTRMELIQQTTGQLLQKIKSCCPNCATPGFGVTSVKEGLPCKACWSPTKSILYTISSCSKCDYSQEIKFPNGNHFEDPMYCDVCNP